MDNEITGYIDVLDEVSGFLEDGAEICGTLELPITIIVPDYEGDYEVTPKMYEETTLPTTGKKCTEDITVHKIPQYEVSNPAGGITAIIGDEYYV